MKSEDEADAAAQSTPVVADDRRPAALERAQVSVTCLNCGAIVATKFCGHCAQPAHVHRSLGALTHDILHSVFHLEGKLVRTLPLLIRRPGELTRRYVHGERAKFVSPLGLFLVAVFVMFAAFSFIHWADPADVAVEGRRDALETTERSIAAVRERLADPALPPQERLALEDELEELELARSLTRVLSPGLDALSGPRQRETAPPSSSKGALIDTLEKVGANRDLLLYKLKTNGYKFSWLLIPMSIPFMWLMFVRRRDVTLYDHAVFVTHSISFMMLFAVVIAAASAIGVTSDFLEPIAMAVPPLHMYVHLRGAYGLSRAGALLRLFFLLLIALVISISFIAILFVVGLPS